jgi:hypothetical protein
MNLTLAVDEQTVERARQVARQQGTSLNALIREYVERLAGQLDGDAVLAEFEAMWEEPGDSRGARLSRDDVYEERLRRTRPR